MVRPLVLAVALACAAASQAEAALKVVATTSDLGAVASMIGRDRVIVTNLAKPTDDPHAAVVTPPPSLLAEADVLIETGGELEKAWLRPLVDAAHNSKIATGAKGQVVAAEGIQLIDAPENPDRTRDVHPDGNPHFMMSPVAAAKVAEHIAEAFCALDAPSCATFRGNAAAFQGALDKKMLEWMRALAPFRGATILSFHPSWKYFASRFQLTTAAADTATPGKREVLVVEPYQSRPMAESLAARIGAVIAEACQYPGCVPGTDDDYIALIDADVKAISAALRASKK